MAIDMRECIKRLSEKWSHDLDADLGFGVGIDHDYATTGRVGFRGRFGYAAIGPPTNKAARICAEAGDQQILVTQPVYAAVEDLVEAEFMGHLELKGMPEPVRVHNVLRLK